MTTNNPTQNSERTAVVNNAADSTGDVPLTSGILQEFFAAIVVACVAIPMGMGIASTSSAPPIAGIIAGIIGGLVVGWISGSPTSITGPSAGLTFAIASLMGTMNNAFDTFLLAVVIAGLIQVLFGIFKLGWLSSFFPASVLDALLAAIGIILIFKQIPHLFGHDSDPEGDMAFLQPDRRTTFTELISLFEGDIHIGATAVGILTLVLIIGLQFFYRSKKFPLPGMLIGWVMRGSLMANT
jgi:carbonic anhydrase